MENSSKNILMVYVEPTPYIVGLIEELSLHWQGNIDILFLAENLSQNWNIKLKTNYKILAKNKIKKLFQFISQLSQKKYNSVHLAGWGSSLLILFIFISKYKKLFVTIESDRPATHYPKLWRRFLKRLTYPMIFSLVDLFLPGGKSQAKYIEHYGVDPENIYPVQMTVDTIKIKKYASVLNIRDREKMRKDFNIPETALVFIYVGRLEAGKGIDELISAFNLINNPASYLLMVGEGSLQKGIEFSAKENKRIICTGRLSNNELINAYFIADVLILPSHSDSWGLVVNEAMTMKLPVIVSDKVGCIDDLVIPFETGLVFPAAQIMKLKNALEYMINFPEERVLMGNNAAQRIANWTLENEAKNMCYAWSQL